MVAVNPVGMPVSPFEQARNALRSVSGTEPAEREAVCEAGRGLGKIFRRRPPDSVALSAAGAGAAGPTPALAQSTMW